MGEGMEISIKQIEKAHAAAGDGKMRGCIGGYCLSSCCRPKIAELPSGNFTHRTLLFNDAEAVYYARKANPSLGELGVNLRTVPALGGRVSGQVGQVTRLHLIDQCQNDDGSCKMGREKPLVCSAYPFSLDPQSLLVTDCVRVLAICEDKAVLDRVMAVRSALGFDDNFAWYWGLQQAITDIHRRAQFPVRLGRDSEGLK